jgi:hypothetical protein
VIAKSLLGAVLALVLSISEPTVTHQQLAPTDQTAPNCEPPRIVLVRPGRTPPGATYQSSSMPPERYRGDKQVTVYFTTPGEVERICSGGRKRICGFRRLACLLSDGRIIAPHPRDYATESFGRTIAHEVGHSLGWPAEHGE